jgi:hypothetical protein
VRAAVLLSALCCALALCAVAMAAAGGDLGQDPVAPPPAGPEAGTAPDVAAPPALVPVPLPPAPPATPAAPSRALGRPTDGSLLRGVQLPAEGPDHYTWDPVLKRFPSRGWRRWGTDRLVRTVQEVLADVRARHPELPRLAIGDLSRPRGGRFGRTTDFVGHASHQNGLDVDIYYPRDDRRRGKPRTVGQVDRGGSQLLVDAFVDAGAQYVFVGLNVGLTGPPAVVQAIGHHDDHLHVRLPPDP